MCVDMEGTLLTVEETVELAPVSTPTPRRRSPRPRAAAKPAAESPGDGVAEPEAVAALEVRRIVRLRRRKKRLNPEMK